MKCSSIVGLSLIVLFSCNENKPVDKNLKSDSLIKRIKLNVDTTKSLIVNASINAPHQSTLDSLQGTWISEKDNNDYVIIRTHNYYEINNGDKGFDTSKSRIYFSDSCIGDQISFSDLSKLDSKRENGQYFVLSDLSDSTSNLCYDIDTIDKESLVLFYHGKMLGFHRKK